MLICLGMLWVCWTPIVNRTQGYQCPLKQKLPQCSSTRIQSSWMLRNLSFMPGWKTWLWVRRNVSLTWLSIILFLAETWRIRGLSAYMWYLVSTGATPTNVWDYVWPVRTWLGVRGAAGISEWKSSRYTSWLFTWTAVKPCLNWVLTLGCGLSR